VNEFRGYDASHQEFMRLYARSLPEDHRRRYAALEALKIGFGRIAYVARVGDEPAHHLHRHPRAGNTEALAQLALPVRWIRPQQALWAGRILPPSPEGPNAAALHRPDPGSTLPLRGVTH
jgi:hypothetical protein